MSNVINWRTWGNNGWVEHTAENQPELDVTYEINNTELSGFTSLYNTGIQEGTTLPARGGSSNGPQHEYTFNNGYIWPYVFRRNTNNRHYFKTPNTIVNKVKIKYRVTGALFLIYKFGGVGSPYLTDEEFFNSNDAVIFDTDTLQARLSGYSVRGDALQTYDFLDKRIDPNTGDPVYYWNEDYASTIFLNSCKIKVIDKINHNEKEIELIARNLPYGYSIVKDATIYCTFIVLNNFNPKYSYDGGKVYNTKVIQKFNDEYRYDNQEGQFIYPIFGLFNWDELVTFSGNRLHVQSFVAINNNTWAPNNYLLESIFSGINVNNGFAINSAAELHFYNDWAEPQQTVTVSESTCVENARDMSLDYYYVPVAYNNDSGSYEYYISGITLGEIPPEPEPEPDVPVEKPDFDPEVNYPETPEDVQNLPTPETPQDNSELLDYLKGYIDGQIRQGNFENEEQTPGELILPANARNASWYSASHPFSTACFIGTPTDMSEMVEKIFTCTDCFLAEAFLAISKNFDPSKVVQKILEYPFSTNYMSRALTITQAAPAWNKTCLTWDPVHVNHTVLIAIWAAIVTQGNALGTTALTAALTAFENATNLVPADLEMPLPWGTPHYYDIALKRFFEVDYGTVTINKIFGSFLDYTDVNYNIQIPISNEIIKLDNHMLFEDYTGNEKDQGVVVGVKGIVDLETGDMLLSITRDNDLMYQTTLNVAVDRNYYTKDEVAQLRDIAQGLAKVASGAAMMTMPTAIGSSVGTTQKARLNVNMSPEGTTKNLTATGERGISNTDYERMSSFRSGSTMVDGIMDIGQSTPAEVKVGMGSNTGTTKLLGNQFPILIYDYPEVMIPKQGPYSNPGPWDYTFDYYEEMGLPASTTKVGKGFNKYGAITNVDLNWSHSWSHEELQGFKEDLLRGFYIYDEDHIYRSPGEVYTELFDNPDRFIYSPDPPGYIQGQGMTQGYEATNSIVLINVFSNWEKYIDRFHPDNLNYSIQGGHYYICYDCNVYRDMNIDKPIIDISSEIYTHQNTAIWNGRIYRVSNVDYLPGHIVRLHLQEDYITTWYYFGVVEGIITRSTSYGISNMHDNLPKTVRRIVKRKKFEGGITNADLGTTFVTVCTPTIVMPSNQSEEEE